MSKCNGNFERAVNQAISIRQENFKPYEPGTSHRDDVPAEMAHFFELTHQFWKMVMDQDLTPAAFTNLRNEALARRGNYRNQIGNPRVFHTAVSQTKKAFIEKEL